MVEKIICTNGVRIVYEKMEHVRSTAIGLWIKVGSRNESAEENGLTHFIEHMLFKGTENNSAKQLAEQFDRIGGEMNAFTGKEYTCYHAKVLDHHAPKVVELLADMFFHSKFDEIELEKERQVVFEEILMVEEMPDDDVHEQLWQAMYPNHPLGRPILGTEETLATFSKQSIEQFMEQHYHPGNIVISIAGSIPEGLIAYVEAMFGSFTNKNAIVQLFEAPVFVPGERVKIRETEQSHLCIGFDALSVHDKRIYDLVVLNAILGGNMSSRLFQEVREEKALAYSIFSYHSAHEDSGTLTIYGGTSNKQLNQLEETIYSSIENLLQNGVTTVEVENSKEQLKGNIILGLESSNSRMHRNAKNELSLDEHKGYERVIEDIECVTVDTVHSLQQTIFTTSNAQSIIKNVK